MPKTGPCFTPACFEMQGDYGYGGDPWQGKKPYPRPIDSRPSLIRMYPNAIYGTCPIVPLYDDIRNVPSTTNEHRTWHDLAAGR